MSKKKTRRGFLWIVLILAGAAAWQYQRTGTLLDESKLSGEIEARVNDALLQNKVQPRHIRKEIRLEHKKTLPIPVSWIETDREIVLGPSHSIKEIVASLKKIAAEQKVSFALDEDDPEKSAVLLYRKDRLYQRIEFLRATREKQVSRRLAIVIDDVAGRPQDLETLNDFFGLGIPITFAVMPKERVSREASERIRKKGYEIIMHQPMEPEVRAGHDPGKSVLLSTMSQAEIEAHLSDDLKTVPFSDGLSNHMGSKFTGDPKAVRSLFRAMKSIERNGRPLYFFDSRTARRFVSGKIAQSEKVPALSNQFFLDNEDREESILAQLESVRRRAVKTGQAAAIGHIQRKHLIPALKKTIPDFKKDGIEFVTLSELL